MNWKLSSGRVGYGSASLRSACPYGDRSHFDDWFSVLVHPPAAGAALWADFQLHNSAIHPQRGVIPLRYLLRFTLNVVTDERAAKAISGLIGKAAMHQRSIEEHDIAGIHEDGLGQVTFRDGDGYVGEALGRIRRGCAEDRPMVAAWLHLQTAVGLVTGIEREPSRQTGAWLNA